MAYWDGKKQKLKRSDRKKWGGGFRGGGTCHNRTAASVSKAKGKGRESGQEAVYTKSKRQKKGEKIDPWWGVPVEIY